MQKKWPTRTYTIDGIKYLPLGGYVCVCWPMRLIDEPPQDIVETVQMKYGDGAAIDLWEGDGRPFVQIAAIEDDEDGFYVNYDPFPEDDYGISTRHSVKLINELKRAVEYIDEWHKAREINGGH